MRDVRKGLADKRLMTHASAISYQLLFALVALSLAGLAILSVVPPSATTLASRRVPPARRRPLSPAVFKLDPPRVFWVVLRSVLPSC